MLRSFVNASRQQHHHRLASTSLAKATSATLRAFHSYLPRLQASPAPPKPNAPSPHDQFANSNNAYYFEEMQRIWRQDPAKVHPSWDVYFSGLAKGLRSEDAFQMPPSLMTLPVDAPPIDPSSAQSGESVDDHLKLQLLVRAYQVRGHGIAVLDPLGIVKTKDLADELTIEHYGWTKEDLKREMRLGPGLLPNFVKAGVHKMTIGEVIDACKRTYCECTSLAK